jgi:osmotically-inducible protein OsmY
MTLLQEKPRTRETSDDRLKTQIQHAVANAARPAPTRVEVSVGAGHVVLRGEVSSYYRKQLAQVAAMSVAGVVSVHNAVVVR